MVPRQGPAHSRTPLWPRFQVYAGCVPLAPPPTEDFVPYNFLSLAVPPGSCSHLSSRPLPHYHRNSGSSLSLLHKAGGGETQKSLLLVPFAHTATMSHLPTLQLCPICPHCASLLSCWPLALEWAIFGAPIVPYDCL